MSPLVDGGASTSPEELYFQMVFPVAFDKQNISPLEELRRSFPKAKLMPVEISESNLIVQFFFPSYE